MGNQKEAGRKGLPTDRVGTPGEGFRVAGSQSFTGNAFTLVDIHVLLVKCKIGH